MRILALQLKRIGDLILTTAALRALRVAWPEAHQIGRASWRERV